MTGKWLVRIGLVVALGAGVGASIGLVPVTAATTPDAGRFVWRDLMTRDVGAAKRFYTELFGWRFEDTKRNGRAYALARLGSEPVAGIVDVSAIPDAAPQWISFMTVEDVDQKVALVTAKGGQVLLAPRDVATIGRAAVVADPQGAPLGLATLRREVADPLSPTPSAFFWQEYLARDASQAIDFYKQLAGYESSISDTRLGLEYHILKRARSRAGLFQLPATVTGVLPNWLPYVLVADPAALAARVPGLGGSVLVPPSPERRNGSLAVVADPGGAPLALQKFPF